MAYHNGVTSAFFGGEATPEYAGRIDIEELRNTFRYAKNFVPTCQGGLKKFWGTWFIKKLALGSDFCRLIPLSGMAEPMSLLFCDNKTYKVTKDGVEDQGLAIFTSNIINASYVQNNYNIYFACKGQQPFMLIYDGNKFSFKTIELEEEPFFPVSWSKRYNGAIRSYGYQGDVIIDAAKGSGTEYSLYLPANLGDLQFHNVVATYKKDQGTEELIPFGHLSTTTNAPALNKTTVSLVRVRNDVETTVITSEIGNSKITKFVSASSGVELNAYAAFRLVELPQLMSVFKQLNPISISDGQLWFLNLPSGHQTSDQYYIKLDTTTSGPGNYYLGYEDKDFNYGCVCEGRVSLPSVSEGTKENAQDIESRPIDFGNEDILGMRIRVHIQTGKDVKVWSKGVAITSGQVYTSDGKYYKALSSGTSGDIQPVHTEGTRSDGNINFEYMHDGYGYATVIEVPSSTQMLVRVDGYLPIVDSTGTEWFFDHFQWSQWGYNGIYPDKIFFNAGRLGVIYDTDEDGSWLQMSKSNNYYDFGLTENGQTTDTCGINVLLSGHPDNRINWVLSAERLYLGSYSGEYCITGADTRSNIITPTSLSIKPISSCGGAPVTPVRYKRQNLFVSSTSQMMYTLSYAYQTDDYSPADVSSYGEEVMKEGVMNMGILKNNEELCFYETGKYGIGYFSYEDEFKQLSFFRADLDGFVMSTCVSECKGYTTQFVVVKRGDKFYIEYIDSTDPSYCLSAIRGKNDGALQYFGYNSNLVCVTESTKDVYDVSLVGNTVVGVPLEQHLNESVIVGSKMECEIHLTPAYAEKMETAVQKSVRFSIRVLNSGPFSYGSSNDFATYYKYEQGTNNMTGDIMLPSSFGYMRGQNTVDGPYPNDTGTALNIKTDAPLPFNLLLVNTLYI